MDLQPFCDAATACKCFLFLRLLPSPLLPPAHLSLPPHSSSSSSPLLLLLVYIIFFPIFSVCHHFLFFPLIVIILSFSSFSSLPLLSSSSAFPPIGPHFRQFLVFLNRYLFLLSPPHRDPVSFNVHLIIVMLSPFPTPSCFTSTHPPASPRDCRGRVVSQLRESGVAAVVLCGGGVAENGGYGCGRVENGGYF